MSSHINKPRLSFQEAKPQQTVQIIPVNKMTDLRNVQFCIYVQKNKNYKLDKSRLEADLFHENLSISASGP